MTKDEIKEILVENYGEDIDELKGMTKAELEELLDELSDDTVMYPNGRDDD